MSLVVRTKSNTAQAQAVATTSTSAVAFTAQPGELVLMSATARAYLVIGGSGVSAASASAHTIQVGVQPITYRLQAGDTHFRVIRVAADGVLTITRLNEDSSQ